MALEQFEQLVGNYGYLGVLVGTFVEGDFALLAGGLLARLYPEVLQLHFVILAGFSGAILSDQFFFYLGRFKGLHLLNWRPRWRERAEMVFRHLRKHATLIAIAFRFCYGFRILTPLLIGASGLKRLRFLALNVTGAFSWAAIVGTLGFIVGDALVALLPKIKHFQLPLLLGVAILVLVAHLIVTRIRRNRNRRAVAGADDGGVPA